MSVTRAQSEITSREFAEWQAYDRLDPFGQDRADLRAGIVAAASLQPHMKKGRRARPADFMPDFAKRLRRKQSPQLMEQKLKAYVTAHNAYVNRNGAA